MLLSIFMIALEASLAMAGPVVKKADYDPLPGGDIDILNYALTLEYLERKFYREGLQKYSASDFQSAGCKEEFYENLVRIKEDEEVTPVPDFGAMTETPLA